jgi:transglutaminase-like putative cysteine protease
MRLIFELMLCLFLVCALAFAGGPSRQVEATYIGQIDGIPAGAARLDIWIPLPAENSHQSLTAINVESPFPMSVQHDADFGNAYLYASISKPQQTSVTIKVRFQVERSEIRNRSLAPIANWNPAPATVERFLKPDRLVSISPRIWKLSDKITAGQATNEAKAKAIYDYVVNNMTYDKSVPGWGNGDTERACDIKKGNCTDFHSLFISLARAAKIPTRFVIGFPLKNDAKGTVEGYHCWAEFYLAGHGWVPVDASEASKSQDPERRKYLFANLDPDRIEFTIGRDLRLDPPQAGPPINYFIYPYAEADGKPVPTTKIRLEYSNLPAAQMAQSHPPE